jgi:hypothetical protein
MAVGHRCLFDWPPVLPWTNPATHFTGKAQAWHLTETDIVEHLPHFCAGNMAAILAAPTFDDFWMTSATVSAPWGWASEIVALPIVRRPGAQLMTVSERTLPILEGETNGERFERRAGLKGIGHGAIAQLAAGQPLAIVRVVGRPVGQRDDLAGAHVEHDDATSLGIVLGDRLLEVAVGQVLNLRIERQADFLAILRRLDRTDVLDDLAAPILDDAAATRLAQQLPDETPVRRLRVPCRQRR